MAEPLAADLSERRQVDFIPAFALPLASSVIGHLLGLDTFLFRRVKRWAEDVTAISGVQPGDTERQEQVRTSVEELTAYLEEAIDARRHRPREDVVSALLQARVEGEALTQQELLGFLFLLLVAGLETTVLLLGNAVRLLRRAAGGARPGAWRARAAAALHRRGAALRASGARLDAGDHHGGGAGRGPRSQRARW